MHVIINLDCPEARSASASDRLVEWTRSVIYTVGTIVHGNLQKNRANAKRDGLAALFTSMGDGLRFIASSLGPAALPLADLQSASSRRPSKAANDNSSLKVA